MELQQHPEHCRHLHPQYRFCPVHAVASPSRSFCGKCEQFDPLPIGSRPKIQTRRVRRRVFLGNVLEKVIAAVTFNQGKRIAKAIGRLLGRKGCGCNSRKRYLNRWSWYWPPW